MFINLIALCTVTAYMINGHAGFFFMLWVIVLVMSQKKTMVYKLFFLTVTSLPLCYIGILGMDMYQIVTWTNLFLVLLFLELICRHRGRIKLHRDAFVVILLLFLVLCMDSVLHGKTQKSVVEVIQVFMMIIPVYIIYSNWDGLNLPQTEISELVSQYADVCVVTALAAVIQWAVYFQNDTEIGFIVITSQGARVICNCLFKGMSILSVFLGAGFVFFMLNMETASNKVILIFKMLIILCGLVVNTSRTGFAGIAIVVMLYYARNLFKKSDGKALLTGILGISGIACAAGRLAAVRGNLFDENGRIMTWKAGIMIWMQNSWNFLFGAGFEDSIWMNGGGYDFA